MMIVVPKKIKINENRVSLTPVCFSKLIGTGLRVLVSSRAGFGSGFTHE
ncbi:UNVERIFIED_CONTAM: alanine dehydrogenase, partial [Bacillus amyloliquefaciens DSM 7 = ATCC 23350]